MSITNLPLSSPISKLVDTLRTPKARKGYSSLRQDSEVAHILTGLKMTQTTWSSIVADKPNLAVLGSPQKILPTENGISVAAVGLANQSPRAILKVASSSQAKQALSQQRRVLQMLDSNRRLKNWPYLPNQLVSSVQEAEQTFLLETVIKGHDMRNFLQDDAVRNRLLFEAVDIIDAFHGKTADMHTVIADTLKLWVDEPIELLHNALNQRAYRKLLPKLDLLRDQLNNALIGKYLPQSWVHGDYTPANIMVKKGGISGIIDWELARPYSLPHIDYLHLILATRTAVSGQEIGILVRDFITKKAYWTKDECIILSSADTPQLGDFIDSNTLVLLAWLQLIGSKLAKSGALAQDTAWMRKNISAVLRALPKT